MANRPTAADTARGADSMGRPRTSTRDTSSIAEALSVWLQGQLALDDRPQLEILGGPSGSGFSSETLLFDLVVAGDRRGFVVRLPPPADAFPLFPWYDFDRQVRAMRLVGARTQVPVPAVPWFEPDATVLGAPFFVMERLDGEVAADVPPYVLDGWVLATTRAERLRMEAGVVHAIAGIHEMSATRDELAFLEFDEPGDTPLRRHVAHQRDYYDWIREDRTFVVIDALFGWLEERWPDDDGEAVVSWGDSRLANVLFRDAEPVAVLDWEAVALGPRELDIGWLLFFHDYFQRIARRLGQPGLPDLLQRFNVEAAYAEVTGYQPRHLDWFLAYAALRQALTSIRVSMRAVRFAERSSPDDLNDLVMDRQHLERIISS